MADALTITSPTRQKVPLVPIGATIAIGDKIIGAASSFTVGVSRNKLPVWALGKIDPYGYGRGTRLITGILNEVMVSGMSPTWMALFENMFGNNKKCSQFIATILGDGRYISQTDRLALYKKIYAALENKAENNIAFDCSSKPSEGVELYKEQTESGTESTMIYDIDYRIPLTTDEFEPVTINLIFGSENKVQFKKKQTDTTETEAYFFTILTIKDVEFMSEGAFVNTNTEAILEELRFVARELIPHRPFLIIV